MILSCNGGGFHISFRLDPGGQGAFDGEGKGFIPRYDTFGEDAADACFIIIFQARGDDMRAEFGALFKCLAPAVGEGHAVGRNDKFLGAIGDADVTHHDGGTVDFDHAAFEANADGGTFCVTCGQGGAGAIEGAGQGFLVSSRLIGDAGGDVVL